MSPVILVFDLRILLKTNDKPVVRSLSRNLIWHEVFMKYLWTWLMRFCHCCIQLVAKPFHIKITDENWVVWEQFFKFALVGVSNAVVTILVYDVVILAFGEHTYLAGQTVGYIAGIFNSYFWNSRYVFSKGEQKRVQSFVKMCTCYGITFFFQMALLYLLVEYGSVSAFLAPLIAIFLITPINFFLNRFWAFQKK